MLEDNADRWISRQELAQRYGVPVKTLAEWASKGTGPRYAKFGRYVRYRLTDVINWEQRRLTDQQRKPGEEPGVVERSDTGRVRDGQG
jgi:predicted DNA-binding transcriptional regulator AlpA